MGGPRRGKKGGLRKGEAWGGAGGGGKRNRGNGGVEM